ncbi:MAG: 50S ribosomal protein L1 [Candidatus Omnitrophota bacterium]
MTKVSKRMKQAYEKVEKAKVYSLKEGISVISTFPKVKFDESVELHFHLDVDLKSSDQAVRGTVLLSHGTGKKIRVIAFCKGEQALQAKEAGADFVGAEELIDKVMNGFFDFDCVVATPDIMRELSKLGRVLGPKGLMPSPKAGTVAADIGKAIREVKAGRVEFKSDKQGGVHVGIGKRSFSGDQLHDNAKQVIDAVVNSKPAAVKGDFVKTLFLSTTMGPGLRIAL